MGLNCLYRQRFCPASYVASTLINFDLVPHQASSIQSIPSSSPFSTSPFLSFTVSPSEIQTDLINIGVQTNPFDLLWRFFCLLFGFGNRQHRSCIPKNKSSPFTVPKKKIFLDSPTVCGSKSIGENGARKNKMAFNRPVATGRTPPRPRGTASQDDISNQKAAGGGGPRGSQRQRRSGRR